MHEARGQWLWHVKFRWKVQLSAIETHQVSIVNTHKVYITIIIIIIIIIIIVIIIMSANK